MKYTKKQLIGTICKQGSNEYVLLDDKGGDSMKFQKTSTKEDYKGYSVSRINNMISGMSITLITEPNSEPQYEIY